MTIPEVNWTINKAPGVHMARAVMQNSPETKITMQGLPGGAMAGNKNLPANAGDAGSICGLGRSHFPRSN